MSLKQLNECFTQKYCKEMLLNETTAPSSKNLIVEDEDEYGPFRKGRYAVYGVESLGREDIGKYQHKATDSPEEAIKYWFKFEKNTPTETDIITQTKANADELIDWAFNNLDKIEQFYNIYAKGKCGYTLEYYIEEIKRVHERGQLGRFDYKYGEPIYPFCCG